MPLPDANNYSTRIYELLKETDLENLTYAQFQGVAETLFIEPENEDEMRRLVLVQLARMAVRGDWDGFLTGATAAPVTSLVAGTNITLSPVTGLGDVTINAAASPVTSLVAGTNVTLSPVSGLGDVTINASGEIGGTITNDQIARGAATANDIEGSNGLLFDGTSLTVNTLTASDPVLNLASSTKSVSLEVNTSQKLSVKGSADSFILDASSATGGITFPDGTTQITAAAGGGTNNVINGLVTETPTTYAIPLLENLNGQGNTGYANRTTTLDSATDTGSFMYYRPFTASTTGTMSAIINRCYTSAAGASIEVAIYNSDSDGNPQTLIGQCSIPMTANNSSQQTTITPSAAGSMDLTKGDLYWCGIGQTASSTAASLGYYQYETQILGLTAAPGAIGATATFSGYTCLIGPGTPGATFSLLSTGTRVTLALGGLYA